MGNQIKEFQGYVLESAFRSKRIPFKQYAEMSIKLFEESNLNLHQILLLQGHIQKNRKEAETFLDNLHISNVDITIDGGLITEEGELAEHGITILKREGYEKLLNPLEEE